RARTRMPIDWRQCCDFRTPVIYYHVCRSRELFGAYLREAVTLTKLRRLEGASDPLALGGKTKRHDSPPCDLVSGRHRFDSEPREAAERRSPAGLFSRIITNTCSWRHALSRRQRNELDG